MDQTQKKVCIIYDGLQVPATNGVSQRTVEVLARLARRNDITSLLVTTERGECSDKDIRGLGVDTLMVNPDHFYTFDGRRELAERLEEYRFNVIHSTSSHPAVLLYAHHISRLLGVPLITDMHDIDHIRDKALGMSTKYLTMVKLQQRLCATVVDHIIVMSTYDRSILVKMGVPTEKMTLIPNASTIPPIVDVQDQRGIFFVGNMYYQPNANSVQYILQRIAPAILAYDPSLIFYIVGNHPTELETNAPSNVHFLGPVEDLSTIATKCFMGIAPIYEGSGMKVKVQTMASFGLPVAASAEALKGYIRPYPFIHCNDSSDYIACIERLSNDTAFRKRRSHNSYAYIREHYMWDKLIDVLVDQYFDISKRSTDGSIEFDDMQILANKKHKYIGDILMPAWLKESRPVFAEKNYQSMRLIACKRETP